MEKIIGGKCYNTDTARWVARDRRYDGVEAATKATVPAASDFVDEILYITKKGEWFLYGEGGRLSKYGVDSICRGWGIIPMEKSTAMRWLVSFGFTSEAEEYCGGSIADA